MTTTSVRGIQWYNFSTGQTITAGTMTYAGASWTFVTVSVNLVPALQGGGYVFEGSSSATPFQLEGFSINLGLDIGVGAHINFGFDPATGTFSGFNQGSGSVGPNFGFDIGSSYTRITGGPFDENGRPIEPSPVEELPPTNTQQGDGHQLDRR